MAHKDELRNQRSGTIINVISKKMEKDVMIALRKTVEYIMDKFAVTLDHISDLYLKDVVMELWERYRDVDFSYRFDSSSMRPDGGILRIVSKDKEKYPILITEVKNQGTNDLRAKEGLQKQAKGNAIERLGKNVIGFRTALLHESIFPFICFGDGCDFAQDSSILDRVITISMFGEFNKIKVHNEGPSGIFNRDSFYFREDKWTIEEMAVIMKEVAEKSVYYYFSKYGEYKFK
ncbi:MAG: restriction endonuclease [Treponema sp.]|jgi:type II restriction enzyme|nr:restriction endonuclease [Treponema sp.]